jgi:hypothetical protein
LVSDCSGPSALDKELAKPKASAVVTHNDYFVSVKNTDKEDWHDINVCVNGLDYGLSIDLKAGQTVRLDLSHFVKDNGQRFNPAAYRVMEVWIGGGKSGYGYARFK